MLSEMIEAVADRSAKFRTLRALNAEWHFRDARRGRGEVIELLIQFGANPDHCIRAGKSRMDAVNIVSNYTLKPFMQPGSHFRRS